jgi:hypothetical protein
MADAPYRHKSTVGIPATVPDGVVEERPILSASQATEMTRRTRKVGEAHRVAFALTIANAVLAEIDSAVRAAASRDPSPCAAVVTFASHVLTATGVRDEVQRRLRAAGFSVRFTCPDDRRRLGDSPSETPDYVCEVEVAWPDPDAPPHAEPQEGTPAHG